ncbi:hypothetical protein THARTR1_06787 [Trichoderma harzianum]|uniref:Uncharacterized protein n=1 Tax=Trichoderma harzianum TaxID=5544 RepID=A0A2K0U4A5_TRIHA|nr:hypothetical protein THARTR1_06787 [Trichoderma harzianum]
MDVFASMATRSLSSADGNSRPSRAFPSIPCPHIAPSPNEARLQKILCWTAVLGHENLFAAYLDQEPSILDVEDEFGMTPFSCAAFAGKFSVVRRALHQCGTTSAREKTTGTQGPSPLEAAALGTNAQMFVSFLRLLKYFGPSTGESTELDNIPPLDRLPTLEEKDIEDELNIAVRKGQTAIIEKLVQMRLENETTQKEEWLARQMVEAADAGALSLVQVLKSCGAKVDDEVDVVDGEFDHKTTPLMSAIRANRTKVAEFLIIHGAGNEDALRLAVENHRHGIIRALLQAGILVNGDLKTRLLDIATAQKDSTTLMLLEFEKGTGKLATSTDLSPDVDKHFEATVVTFHEEKTPEFKELSVTDLMGKSDRFFSLNGKTHNFKWFHLPANNVNEMG